VCFRLGELFRAGARWDFSLSVFWACQAPLYAWIVALRLSLNLVSVQLFCLPTKKLYIRSNDNPCRLNNPPFPTTRTTRRHNATDMRLPSAYALTATLAFGSVASAQLVDSSLVGTWATKANKTLTGPVRWILSSGIKQLLTEHLRASTTLLATP
jgi:hypothetical protein